MSEWTYSIADSSEPSEPEAPFDDEAEIARCRDAAIQLLPPGFGIAKAPDSGVGELLEGLNVENARVYEQAAILRRNMSIARAEEYLEDWEEAAGLPDSCSGELAGTLAERRGAVIAKVLGRTSHSQPAVEAAALALGYEDLEFERFGPMTCTSECTEALYGDEWANFVRITVPVGDQTADDQLVCAIDALRRSHGFFEFALEGPMGATRTHTDNYFNAHVMSPDFVLADVAPIEIKYAGVLSLQTIIHNVSGLTNAPTDSVAGTWEVWISSDGSTYTKWDRANVTTELAIIAAAGNNVVNEVAVLTDVPGRYAKILFNNSGGGAGDSRVTMHISAW
jgi:uncharacterized protein YmfQ (DUF2313 family)